MNRKLVGRKLYMKWGDDKNPDMYVAIEKIPDGSKKCAEIDLVSKEGLELCNVYENENGELEEEVLGAPALDQSGYMIKTFFTNSDFWKTYGEKLSEYGEV